MSVSGGVNTPEPAAGRDAKNPNIRGRVATHKLSLQNGVLQYTLKVLGFGFWVRGV